MPNLFVSYRRSDAPAHAGRLYDRLAGRFGADSVFHDLDSLEPGADFVDVIEQTLAGCDALIAVIGRDWEGIGESARRRVDEPNDWVRIEIATALKRNVRVIPVLVDGATMPSEAMLPEDLRRLARKQAVELANRTWNLQVDA